MNRRIGSFVIGLALLAGSAGTAAADTFTYPGGTITINPGKYDILSQLLVNTCSNNMTKCLAALEQKVGNIQTPGSWTFGETRITWAPNVTTTPEPLTMALLGTGLAGIGLAARRRRQQQPS